jgi:acetolactate synthase-1/3 small subunit
VKKFIIAVYVDNKFGVLTRVTSMFTRRGFNIDALTVGKTESDDFSRITITMYGDDAAKEQMIKQLKKLVNVKMVKLLSKESSVIRELMLIKVKNDRKTKNDIMTAVSIFRSKIIDYSANALCIEVTGDTEKLDAFIEIMKPLGIIEMCRTGIVALERGEGSLLEQ